MTERTAIFSTDWKYCPYCGTELPREGSPYFCPGCGKDFAWMTSQGASEKQFGDAQQSNLPFGLRYRFTSSGDLFWLYLYPSQEVEGLELHPGDTSRRGNEYSGSLTFKGMNIDLRKLPDMLREALSEDKYNQLVQDFMFAPPMQSSSEPIMFRIGLRRRTGDQDLNSYQQDLDTFLRELLNAIRRQVNSALSENESLKLVLEKYGIKALDESASQTGAE